VCISFRGGASGAIQLPGLHGFQSSSKSFCGCPIPAAAGVISSITLLLLWLDSNEREIGNWKYVLAGLMVLLSGLMISHVEYPSFKSVNWRTKRSVNWVLISIVVIIFTVMNWQWMPAVLFVSYLLYGLGRPWVSRRWRQEIEQLPVEEGTDTEMLVADESADPAAKI